MRKHIIRALYAAAAAGITLATLGFAGAGPPATAAPQSLSPPVYTTNDAGYVSAGRWFRYLAATVTVPPVPRLLLAPGHPGARSPGILGHPEVK